MHLTIVFRLLILYLRNYCEILYKTTIEKMKKFSFFLLINLIISFSFSLAQEIPTTIIRDEDMKGYKKKDFFQFSVLGGFINPLFILNDKYNASPSAGFDFAYRLNKETALFLEGNYIFLDNKDTIAPSCNYLQLGLGTRFYFRAKGVRSAFFFEAAAGPYVYMQSSDNINGINFDSKTIGKFGMNAGMGCEMVLSNHVFVMLKAKYNYIIESKVTKSYVGGNMGLNFRF